MALAVEHAVEAGVEREAVAGGLLRLHGEFAADGRPVWAGPAAVGGFPAAHVEIGGQIDGLVGEVDAAGVDGIEHIAAARADQHDVVDLFAHEIRPVTHDRLRRGICHAVDERGQTRELRGRIDGVFRLRRVIPGNVDRAVPRGRGRPRLKRQQAQQHRRAQQHRQQLFHSASRFLIFHNIIRAGLFVVIDLAHLGQVALDRPGAAFRLGQVVLHEGDSRVGGRVGRLSGRGNVHIPVDDERQHDAHGQNQHGVGQIADGVQGVDGRIVAAAAQRTGREPSHWASPFFVSSSTSVQSASRTEPYSRYQRRRMAETTMASAAATRPAIVVSNAVSSDVESV